MEVTAQRLALQNEQLQKQVQLLQMQNQQFQLQIEKEKDLPLKGLQSNKISSPCVAPIGATRSSPCTRRSRTVLSKIYLIGLDILFFGSL